MLTRAPGILSCLVLLAGCAVPTATTTPTRPLPPATTVPATSAPAQPTEPETTQTPTTTVEPCTQAAASLSLDARIGQLLMVGVDGGIDDAERRAITTYKVGSVVLLGTQDGGVKATADLVAELAQLDPDSELLAAADQEGGVVQRLRGPGFSRIPSAADQAKLDIAKLEESARSWGRQLGKADVQLNLAPVADVVPTAKRKTNAPIGKLGRGYGSDPSAVTDRTAAVISGLADEAVAATVKHFPGLGEVTGNTDHTAGVVDRVTRADSPSLAPFRAAAEGGVGAVMISSATYTRIDPKNRAVFSAKVIGLLRQWGYEGVVISDDLGAAVALRGVAAGERATRFIAAGGDLVINADPGLTGAMVAGLKKRAKADAAFEQRVTQSAARVLTLKQWLGRYECG